MTTDGFLLQKVSYFRDINLGLPRSVHGKLWRGDYLKGQRWWKFHQINSLKYEHGRGRIGLRLLCKHVYIYISTPAAVANWKQIIALLCVLSSLNRRCWANLSCQLFRRQLNRPLLRTRTKFRLSLKLTLRARHCRFTSKRMLNWRNRSWTRVHSSKTALKMGGGSLSSETPTYQLQQPTGSRHWT